MAHVGLYDIKSILSDHASQFLHAFFVGSDLRAQVGHVLRWIATGVGATGQQGQHLCFAQTPGIDQLEVLDLHALFIDVA